MAKPPTHIIARRMIRKALATNNSRATVIPKEKFAKLHECWALHGYRSEKCVPMEEALQRM